MTSALPFGFEIPPHWYRRTGPSTIMFGAAWQGVRQKPAGFAGCAGIEPALTAIELVASLL